MNDKSELNCRTQLATMAYEELEKGDHQMAIKLLTTSIRLQPDNFELYFERSICHHKLGDNQASLNDINTAISLKESDYNLYYQKGLALLGLKMRGEAMTTFKKSIELCARQEDTKFSDIFNLLKNASHEFKAVKEVSVEVSPHQQAAASATRSDPHAGIQIKRTNNITGPTVDSTTDRPSNNKPDLTTQPSRNQNINLINHNNNTINKNGSSNNLVATISNIIPTSNILRIHKLPESSEFNHSNVSSSATTHLPSPFNNMAPTIATLKLATTNLIAQPTSGTSNDNKALQLDWNIRRSERIFLHHSNEVQSPQILPQVEIVTRFNEPQISSVVQKNDICSPIGSNSNKQSGKRPYDNQELQTHQQKAMLKPKEGTNSNGSDVDVDDSYNNQILGATTGINEACQPSQKRVMIAPSSSMPATTVPPPPPPSQPNKTSRDDYSSNYKRLRRDRERARRGTSKLCTIKLSDLEELQKPLPDSSKRFTRVIAPIDGWLYSGQLSVDENSTNNPVQYVVKLDGDASGSSYLFNQETVLNDVIKEVRVKSVSELRKGARICCYWSRQYKCLSTGIVTSRTFEATKSLVSVKYDNGDLSALPLEDLRLLPPDYPKYMSNCDPLLLARSGHGPHSTAALPISINEMNTKTISETSTSDTRSPNDITQKIELSLDDKHPLGVVADKSIPTFENTKVVSNNEEHTQIKPDKLSDMNSYNFVEAEEKFEVTLDNPQSGVNSNHGDGEENDEEDEGATIPPTDETIDFITNDSNLKQNQDFECGMTNRLDDTRITKDNITLTEDLPLNSNSRASSEENNYSMTYCPWVFEGTPRKNKRHGRTYRDTYSSIRRGSEVIRIGDAAELMPRDKSILPFIAKIDGLWATGRGEMRVRVRWYYRLAETEGDPYDLPDGDNALFETDHVDENDIQSIYRSTKILSWSNYRQHHLGHVNKTNDTAPKLFYLAGHYDPVRRIKHLRSDVKEVQ